MITLDKDLKRISDARDILRARGDAVNVLIVQLEEQLCASGACASVTLPPVQVDGVTCILGYYRHSSGWRINVCINNSPAQLLANAPLHVRLIVADQFPALVKYIAEKMENLAL